MLVTLEFTAPEIIGKYASFYVLMNSLGERISQKVMCDISVIEKDSGIMKLQRDLGLLDQSYVVDQQANYNPPVAQ